MKMQVLKIALPVGVTSPWVIKEALIQNGIDMLVPEVLE